MISYIKGTIKDIGPSSVFIATSIGLGFEIIIINREFFKENSEVELHISFQWHQENGPSLYGFLKKEEKALFEMIIECQGIGPKMGISILNQINPDIFVNAIKEGDIKTLSSLNGIGAKKAEQIIVNLKHKISKLQENVIFKASPISKHLGQITEVLNSLNYSKQEISSAIDYVGNTFKDQDAPFEVILRKSLSFLSKKA